jgi:hypothetical protein
MDLNEVRCEEVGWIQVARNRDRSCKYDKKCSGSINSGKFWPAALLSGSQEGLCSRELGMSVLLYCTGKECCVYVVGHGQSSECY